jgi:hypothetical protein
VPLGFLLQLLQWQVLISGGSITSGSSSGGGGSRLVARHTVRLPLLQLLPLLFLLLLGAAQLEGFLVSCIIKQLLCCCCCYCHHRFSGTLFISRLSISPVSLLLLGRLL